MERRVLVAGARAPWSNEVAEALARVGFVVSSLPPQAGGADASATAGPLAAPLDAPIADPAALELVKNQWAVVHVGDVLAPAPLTALDEEQARAVLGGLVVAPFLLLQAAFAAMVADGQGRIVCVTRSPEGALPSTNWSDVAAVSWRSLIDALRVEARRTGVDVVEIVVDGPDLEGASVAEAIVDVLRSGEPPLRRRVGHGTAAWPSLVELLPRGVADRLRAGVRR